MNLQIIFVTFAFISSAFSASKPRIVEQPGDQFPKEGVLNFPCKARGDPFPTITWYNADTKTPASDLTNGNSLPEIHTNVMGQLVIPDPKSGKEYRFYCNASNSEGWVVSRVARAGHAYLNTVFTQNPMHKETRIGDAALLICDPPRGMPPPAISWIKYPLNSDGLERSRGIQISKENPIARIQLNRKGSLRIQKVKQEDEGIYVCVAQNVAGRRESQGAQLSVREKPQFEEISQDTYAKVGQTVEFTCKLKGEHSIVWKRHNHSSMPLSRTTIGSTGISVTIRDVQLSDAGFYICRSTSNAGPVEAVVKLVVNSPPTFSLTPENQHVSEGSDVVFRCISKGFPVPKMYWELPVIMTLFPDDNRFPRYRVYSDGRLEIKSVTMQDQGKYFCNSHSSMDTIHASASLTIDPRPVAPIISLGPQSQILRVGSIATFRCETIGNPRPRISWFKGNVPINQLSGLNYVQMPSGTLQINDIKPNDAGNYTCRADLDQWETKWTAKLTVLTKDENKPIVRALNDDTLLPEAPVNLKVTDVQRNYVTLKWSNPGRDPVNSYRVEMSQPDYKLGWIIVENNWKGVRIQINGLLSGTEYSFLVRSRNSVSLSRASKPTYYVKTLDKPVFNNTPIVDLPNKINEIRIQRLRLSTLSFSQVKVDWDVVASKDVLAVIGGYKVKYQEVHITRCFATIRMENVGPLSMNPNLHCSFNEKNSYQRLQRLFESMRQQANVAGMSQPVEKVKQLPRNHETNYWRNSNTETAVIGDLQPFRCYAFEVEPYSVESVLGPINGRESKAHTILTYEDVPSQPPRSIHAKWINNKTIEITWLPPPVAHWNGLLRGYIIYIFGNDTKYTRKKEINSTIHRSVLTNMHPNMNYMIHMAAVNCKGVGIRSVALALPSIFGGRHSFIQQPWFIGTMVGCTVIWIFLCIFTIYICYYRFRCLCFVRGSRNKREKSFNLEPLIKQQEHVETTSSCASRLTQPPDLTLLDPNKSRQNAHLRQHGPNDYAYHAGTLDKGSSYNESNSDVSPVKSFNFLPNMAPVMNPVSSAHPVAPYASTSIIQIGLGPYSAVHRPMGLNENGSNSHYYSGDIPSCTGGVSEYNDSQVTSGDDWNGPPVPSSSGRHVMNIGQIIPPPPGYPPPPAPPSYAAATMNNSGSHLSNDHHSTSREGSKVSSGSEKLNSGSSKGCSRGPSGIPPAESSEEMDPCLDQTRPLGNSYYRGLGESNSFRPATAMDIMKSSGQSQHCHRGPDAEMLDQLEEPESEEEEVSSVGSSSVIEEEEEECEERLEDFPPEGHHHLNLGAPPPPASPGYSTDTSSYSVLPPAQPHRPYPKSDRKRQMKKQYAAPVGSGGGGGGGRRGVMPPSTNNNHLQQRYPNPGQLPQFTGADPPIV